MREEICSSVPSSFLIFRRQAGKLSVSLLVWPSFGGYREKLGIVPYHFSFLPLSVVLGKTRKCNTKWCYMGLFLGFSPFQSIQCLCCFNGSHFCRIADSEVQLLLSGVRRAIQICFLFSAKDKAGQCFACQQKI